MTAPPPIVIPEEPEVVIIVTQTVEDVFEFGACGTFTDVACDLLFTAFQPAAQVLTCDLATPQLDTSGLIVDQPICLPGECLSEFSLGGNCIYPPDFDSVAALATPPPPSV